MTLPAPYYQDEAVTLYCADCRDILPLLPKVDLVLTDPPYGIAVGGSKGVVGGSKIVNVKIYGKQEWDEKPLAKDVLDIMMAGSDKQIIFGYNYLTDILGPTNNLIIWDKKCQNDWDDNFSDGEIAWCSFKTGLKIYRQKWMGLIKTGEIEGDTDRCHPTQKPLALFTWIVNKYSDNNYSILDPFAGSGTTLVAAKQLGRKAIGIEISQKYCDIAVKRLSQEYLL